MTTCTRCEGTGFLNFYQIPIKDMDAIDLEKDVKQAILDWIASHDEHDVSVCDCCGNGEEWYGEPGEHDERDYGPNGVYAYNGGLPECS